MANCKTDSKENCDSSFKVENNARLKINVEKSRNRTFQEESTETYIKAPHKQVINFLYTSQKSPYFHANELEKTTKISKFKSQIKILNENNDNKKANML